MFVVVEYIDESIHTVMASKVLTGSLEQCTAWVDKKGQDTFAVVRHFDGEEINARFVQQIYPEPL